MMRRRASVVCLFMLLTGFVVAEDVRSNSSPQSSDLEFVLYLSRHGVRSPTGSPDQYNAFSAAPWPAWNIPPGYLTQHGYRLMRIVGTYDRANLAASGLISPSGCRDAAHVTIYADSDERTRETGKALAEGLFPGCAPVVRGNPEGVNDPIFHAQKALINPAESALAVAAIQGSVGGDPNNITAAYRAPLSELDSLLARCGAPIDRDRKRQSILDIPAKLGTSSDGHFAGFHGPLSAASSITETFLLEYVEGMDGVNVGWGCVDGKNVRSMLALHTAASEFSQRPQPIARLLASSLLNQIRSDLEQASTEKPVSGAISHPGDRALFLVGHDTNIASLAGLLGMHWIADGRYDDTPPGGALVFELWRSREDGRKSVRVFYTTQTLEQMRSESHLSPDNPPVRVPVFVPGCSLADLSCSWPDFERLCRNVTESSIGALNSGSTKE